MEDTKLVRLIKADWAGGQTKAAVESGVRALYDADAKKAGRLMRLLLTHKKPELRRKGCILVKSLRRTEFAGILIASLGDANTGVVSRAASALGEVGKLEHVPRIASVLRTTTSMAVRLAAIEAIGRLGVSTHSQLLTPYLETGTRRVKMAAARACEILSTKKR